MNDDVATENCDLIVFFTVYSQIAAIVTPESRRMVYKSYISMKSNLLPHKNWKQN